MRTSTGAERTGTLTSVHCLVRSARRPSIEGAPPGLDGAAPVRLIDAGDGLWIVASDVPEPMYDEDAIRAGLADMDWVARHAVAHERVVERFLDADALIPMKLFTLYRGDERALADVAGRRAALDRVLAEVGGRREWGLRALARDPAPSEAAAGLPDRAVSATPGTDFLRRKQGARDAARLRREAQRAAADELYATLAGLSARAVRGARPPEAAGSRLVLEAAFLVASPTEPAFREAVRAASDAGRAQGLEIVLTGPWAPYHFVEAGA